MIYEPSPYSGAPDECSIHWPMKLPCVICGNEVPTPYDTPDDPPFFPIGGGKHCEDCEHWLQTGEVE